MCTLAPARAHQVQIGVEQGLDADSNVLSSAVAPIDEGLYKLTPTIVLEQPDSKWTYKLDYRPSLFVYFRTDGIDGWNHVLRGQTAYEASARDRLRLRGDYVRARGFRSNTFIDSLGQAQAIPTQLGTVERFVVDLGWDHSFSARTLGTVSFNYNRWDYTSPTNVGNQALGAGLQATHALTSRLTVGANVDARYRAFDETSFAPASFTTVINANAVLGFGITDRLRLEASGGPAGVLSRQGTPGPQFVSRWSPVPVDPDLCPGGDCGRIWGPVPAPAVSVCPTDAFGVPILAACPSTVATVTGIPGFPNELVIAPLDPNQNVFGNSVESLTYFVNISLVYRFRKGSLRLAFVRTEDAGSGFGATTLVNSPTLTFSHRITDAWSVRVMGMYLARDSVSNFPSTAVSARPSAQTFGGFTLAEAGLLIARFARSDLQQRIGTLDVSLDRVLTQNSRIRLRFRYYNQSQSFAGGAETYGFDRYIGGIFYVYEFDPYRF